MGAKELKFATFFEEHVFSTFNREYLSIPGVFLEKKFARNLKPSKRVILFLKTMYLASGRLLLQRILRLDGTLAPLVFATDLLRI